MSPRIVYESLSHGRWEQSTRRTLLDRGHWCGPMPCLKEAHFLIRIDLGKWWDGGRSDWWEKHLFCFFFSWLHWVFVAAHWLFLVSGSRGYLWCGVFSFWWLLLLLSRVLGPLGFSSCQLGLSCSAVCGIFPDQGWNLWPLHWQILNHQPTREVPPFLF